MIFLMALCARLIFSSDGTHRNGTSNSCIVLWLRFSWREGERERVMCVCVCVWEGGIYIVRCNSFTSSAGTTMIAILRVTEVY